MGIEIDFLAREVLTEIVRDFETPAGLKIMESGLFGSPMNEGVDTVTWDIKVVNRELGNYEGLESEATPIALRTISQQHATVIRDFKSKKIPGNKLINLRNPGSESKLRIAEDFVVSELEDLFESITRSTEWLMAQAMQGIINVVVNGIPITIDMRVPALHKPTVATSWEAIGADIINDIKTFKELAEHDSGFPLDRCFISPRISAAMFKNDQINFTLAHTPTGTTQVQSGRVGTVWGVQFDEYNVTTKAAGASVVRNLDEKKAVFYSSRMGWAKLLEAPEVVPTGEESMGEESGLTSYAEITKNPTSGTIYAVHKRLPVIQIPNTLVIAQVIP